MMFVILPVKTILKSNRTSKYRITSSLSFVVKFIYEFKRYYGRPPTRKELSKLFNIPLLLRNYKSHFIVSEGILDDKPVTFIDIKETKTTSLVVKNSWKGLAERYIQKMTLRKGEDWVSKVNVALPIKVIW